MEMWQNTSMHFDNDNEAPMPAALTDTVEFLRETFSHYPLQPIGDFVESRKALFDNQRHETLKDRKDAFELGVQACVDIQLPQIKTIFETASDENRAQILGQLVVFSTRFSPLDVSGTIFQRFLIGYSRFRDKEGPDRFERDLKILDEVANRYDSMVLRCIRLEFPRGQQSAQIIPMPAPKFRPS
jgi:hypothetical protein